MTRKFWSQKIVIILILTLIEKCHFTLPTKIETLTTKHDNNTAADI